MQVMTMSVGALCTNCYILHADNGEAVLIDPGADGARLRQYLDTQSVRVRAIWLTHGHFDHIGAVNELKAAYACPVVAHRTEIPLLGNATANLSYQFQQAPCTVTVDTPVDDEDVFFFAGTAVRVLHTPGHTAGSCCYVVEDKLFSGDTLFCGAVGRTDFPTGDAVALQRSLQKLVQLPANYTVYPGHGEQTTVFAEKAGNPYID